MAKHRPKVPENAAENERLTSILLDLDERDSLSPEEDALFKSIAILVEHYEHQHYPIEKLSPAEALRAVMEDRGLKHKGVAEIIGIRGSPRKS